MPGGVAHITCILRVDVQLTREKVWKVPNLSDTLFFTLIKALSLDLIASYVSNCLVNRCEANAVCADTNISAEACS